jgi:hypothetical protein
MDARILPPQLGLQCRHVVLGRIPPRPPRQPQESIRMKSWRPSRIAILRELLAHRP